MISPIDAVLYDNIMHLDQCLRNTNLTYISNLAAMSGDAGLPLALVLTVCILIAIVGLYIDLKTDPSDVKVDLSTLHGEELIQEIERRRRKRRAQIRIGRTRIGQPHRVINGVNCAIRFVHDMDDPTGDRNLRLLLHEWNSKNRHVMSNGVVGYLVSFPVSDLSNTLYLSASNVGLAVIGKDNVLDMYGCTLRTITPKDFWNATKIVVHADANDMPTDLP